MSDHTCPYLLEIDELFIVQANFFIKTFPDIYGSLSQSSWDNSVPCVKAYIKSRLNDPSSYESVHWDKASQSSDGTYSVTHTYRAKNGFGGMVKRITQFKIDYDGQTVINTIDF